MDAVIQVEASELTLRTRYSCAEVITVKGEAVIIPSAWVTVLFDQLRLIKESLWANAPNELQINYRII